MPRYCSEPLGTLQTVYHFRGYSCGGRAGRLFASAFAATLQRATTAARSGADAGAGKAAAAARRSGPEDPDGSFRLRKSLTSLGDGALER